MAYQAAICEEWVNRGYLDTCLEKTNKILAVKYFKQEDLTDEHLPVWIGDEAFHISHQSNLTRKYPEWYGPLWPDVPPDIPYIWPG